MKCREIATKIRLYYGFERATADRGLRNFLINLLPDLWIINRYVRPAMARLCGVQCGSGSTLGPHIFYGNPQNLRIGVKCTVARNVFFDCYGKIIIGNHVAIAFQSTFITSSHEISGEDDPVGGKLIGKPIIIEDGVWIGARAIIGAGTKVGAGSIVVPGTSLMRSVPANSVVVGVPGRVVTRLVKKQGENGVGGPT